MVWVLKKSQIDLGSGTPADVQKMLLVPVVAVEAAPFDEATASELRRAVVEEFDF